MRRRSRAQATELASGRDSGRLIRLVRRGRASPIGRSWFPRVVGGGPDRLGLHRFLITLVSLDFDFRRRGKNLVQARFECQFDFVAAEHVELDALPARKYWYPRHTGHERQTVETQNVLLQD